MRAIENFKQAQQALNQFIPPQPGARRYSLDCITKLMDYLDNPQNKLKIVHVAGTSGKTSTSYYVASLLHKSGYKVGLTVSPHVDEVNERAQIDLKTLPEKKYCEELSQFLDIVDKSGLVPSYFEVLIAFAYWLFHKYQVDYAVVEVGLGGLLDCTNVVNRTDKVCIITDIGQDHTEVLGSVLDEITVQKAGIIQQNNIVFSYRQSEVITRVVIGKCREKSADLHIIETDYLDDVNLTTLPLFQRRNFNLALQTVDYIKSRDNVGALTIKEIQEASKIYIPARMEIISYHGKTLILDGSHNEQKIGALVTALHQQFPDTLMTILASFGNNKQSSVLASLKLLRSLSSTIIITRFVKGQDEARSAIEPEELVLHAKEAGFTTVIIEPEPYLALELLGKSNMKVGLITGSFYLLNHIRPVIIELKKVYPF
jgi:dihydrofolate synthase/folylpolyglutamate synthase